MKNCLYALIGAWVCSLSIVLADELPATVRFLNFISSDVAPSVEVKGYPKVDLEPGRVVGPVGLNPGEYQLVFLLGENRINRAAKLEAGRGKLFILAAKSGDAAVMEFQALHRDDLAGADEGRLVRIINLTADQLDVETSEGEHELEPGGEQLIASKQNQLALTVGDEVVSTVDLRDLNACSVVFYLGAENKLASAIIAEPITSSVDDE